MWIIIPIILIIVPILLVFAMWIAGFFVALFIDLILVLLSIRIVRPNTVYSVEFLWKYNRVLRQWFHFIIPILEWTKKQFLYKRNLVVNVEWVTSDNVTCFIWLNVIYFVNDDWDNSVDWNIYKSLYSIDNPLTMIKATIDEQLRAMMIQFTHKEIFWKREEIWEEIEEKLRTKLKSFWFRLDSIQVRDVSLEKTVMSAMNKVVESLKLKEAAYNEWEAKKIMKVKEAEAEKETQILLWQWMAGQRMEIAKWFEESINEIKKADPSLTADKILEFLLDSFRIETLAKIWYTQNSKLIYLNENLEWKWLEGITKLTSSKM